MGFFLKYWPPFLAWMAMIFIASGDFMSAEHTSRFIVPFLLWLKPDFSPEALEQIHFLVRKLGHITEYAILAMLFWRAVFHGTHLRWPISTMFLYAFIICLLVAVTDEFRQSFVASRGASPWDVMIDAVGVLAGLAIYFLMIRHTVDQSKLRI